MKRTGRHAAIEDAPAAGGTSIVDLHTHTTRSDGVLSPAELAGAVTEVGVRTLSITDHDSLAAPRELRATGAIPASLELISGVEINALAGGIPLAEGELHILGFGVDEGDEAFEAKLAAQRTERRRRFERTVARLREIDLPIDDQVARLDLTRDDALGRPTIARALIAAGFAETVEDAFRRLIGWGGPAYVPRAGLGPLEAIRAIRAAEGLPVLAHFGEAPDQIPLLRQLREAGLGGLEVHYRTFRPDTIAALESVADELGFVATGGSDYHGDLMTYAEAHASLNVPSEVADAVRVAIAR